MAKPESRVAQSARGSFKSKHITQTDSVSTPIIKHIPDEDKLEYLFYHLTKGYRIFQPNGEEQTPHHDRGAWGKRFLAVTDQRLIYIVGQEHEDVVKQFDYYDVIDVDYKLNWTHGIIRWTTQYDREYKFSTEGSLNKDIEDAGEYIETRIQALDSIQNKYDELVNQVSDINYKEISVPSPQSFDSPEKCEEKYHNLFGMIEKWALVESKFNEVKESRSKIIDQLPAHNRETWVRIVPNIDTPKEFDTADEAISEYTSLQEDFEGLGSVINGISIIFEHNSVISEYAPEKPESDPSSVLEKITTTVERELNSQRDVSEVGKDLERVAEILTVSSRLANEGGDLPIEPFLQEVIKHLQEEGIPESEKLQEWYDLIQKVEKISMFIDDVDLSHPSIDAEHWEKSIETALEEQYVNILSPIADQVEKMESGMWELGDLHQISWQEFETLIGTLYESFGYETEVTSDTADMGIDVWATNADERVAIQAKRYQEGNRVGRETLQKLASTLAKGDADRVIVVTTSEFARTAKEYSESFGSEIELINGEELRDQLNNSDIPPIN